MTTTLLTGIPRSGTTLLCALLNEMPDSVALAEPIPKLGPDAAGVLQAIDEFVARTRRQLLETGEATSKTLAGRIAGNFMPEPGATDRLRPSLAKTTSVKIDKALSPEFRLYIKHPASFTAVLPILRRHYPVFAVVRHPLSVLASWQTVKIPVQRGALPAAERLDPALRDRLESLPDTLDRQVEIIGWFLERYSSLPRKCILFHEHLVSNPKQALHSLHPAPVAPTHLLYDQAPAERYPSIDLEKLSRALKRIEPQIARFYPASQSGQADDRKLRR